MSYNPTFLEAGGGGSFSAPEAQRLGADAFAFGFPLLTMLASMQTCTNVLAPGGGRAPLNQFAHLDRFPGPGFSAIVAANANTLYSLAWLDLSAEPLVLSLPDTGGRSFLMPLFDAWTRPIACLGPRRTEASTRTYALAGPDWNGSIPGDMRRIDAPTNTVWAIGHIHANDREDLDLGLAIQRGITLAPLSAYGTAYTPSAGIVDPALASTDPRSLVMRMGAEVFLRALAAGMDSNPARADDHVVVDRLKAIDLRRDQPFSWASLHIDIRKAIELGFDEGREAVAKAPPEERENNWVTLRNGSTPGSIDYLRRAQVANAGLCVTDREDASFDLTARDSGGINIKGGSRYVMRFEADELPPVGALWSLGLYDMDQCFTDNAIDRYALGDRDELELGADGSLEIAIQRVSPSGSSANWLPAPEGDFNLMLHMYWPSQRALDGDWTIPPVRRVN